MVGLNCKIKEKNIFKKIVSILNMFIFMFDSNLKYYRSGDLNITLEVLKNPLFIKIRQRNLTCSAPYI